MSYSYLLFLLFPLIALSSSPIPLFLWSNQRYFTADHGEVSDAVAVSDVKLAIKSLISSSNNAQGQLDKFISPESNSAPEVILAFVPSKIGSADLARGVGAYSTGSAGKFSSLKDDVLKSQSSLVAPYVFPSGASFSDELVDAVSSSSSNARVILGSASGCSALESTINEDSQIASNGVTDLVLLQADNLTPEYAQCVAKILAQVEAKKTSYLALVSADRSALNVITDFPVTTAPVLAGLQSRRLLAVDADGYNGPQYITPTILFAILLSFFLIFVLWTGLSCLMNIETPVRFAYQIPAHSMTKEY